MQGEEGYDGAVFGLRGEEHPGVRARHGTSACTVCGTAVATDTKRVIPDGTVIVPVQLCSYFCPLLVLFELAFWADCDISFLYSLSDVHPLVHSSSFSHRSILIAIIISLAFSASRLNIPLCL